MINLWAVSEPKQVSKCIIGLTGRGQEASHMLHIAKSLDLPDTLLVAIEPEELRWYPQPISSVDQDEAVAGLPLARAAIGDIIKSIQWKWNLFPKDITLIGFSAGGVMAVDIATKEKEEYGAIVCFAGAILNPYDTPQNDKDTPFLLIHNKDDYCFDWKERYLPMKEKLVEQGYNVTTLEKRRGNHRIFYKDVVEASNFIGQHMIDPSWQHPESQ